MNPSKKKIIVCVFLSLLDILIFTLNMHEAQGENIFYHLILCLRGFQEIQTRRLGLRPGITARPLEETSSVSTAWLN